MDRESHSAASHSVVVTGLGHVVSERCDPSPFLRIRKNRKFMGVQDDLAVIAAGKAIEDAGIAGGDLGERTGLYIAVGYIPFEQADMDELMKGSIDERGEFSMQCLSTSGYASLNPLLTFRCLSNMPAFHISVNFGVEGPYFVTYPGPGQFYIALDRAARAIENGEIDRALVAGVAHQRNFLVEHHFRRLDPPVTNLLDAGGCLVLESQAHASSRNAPARARLMEWDIRYEAHDPFRETIAPRELGADSAMGPASLPVALSLRGAATLRHELTARDGIHASSHWELM